MLTPFHHSEVNWNMVPPTTFQNYHHGASTLNVCCNAKSSKTSYFFSRAET